MFVAPNTCWAHRACNAGRPVWLHRLYFPRSRMSDCGGWLGPQFLRNGGHFTSSDDATVAPHNWRRRSQCELSTTSRHIQDRLCVARCRTKKWRSDQQRKRILQSLFKIKAIRAVVRSMRKNGAHTASEITARTSHHAFHCASHGFLDRTTRASERRCARGCERSRARHRHNRGITRHWACARKTFRTR